MGTLLIEGKTLFPRVSKKTKPPSQSLMIDRILSLAAESGIATSLAILEVTVARAQKAESGTAERRRVLRKLAGLLKDQTPNEFLFDRWGASGFICLHPGGALTATAQILERISGLPHGQLEREVPQKPIIISIGLAGFPQHGNTRIEILRRAEEALFVARRAGKDTIQLPPAEVLHGVTVPLSAIQIERLSALATHEGINAQELIREAVDEFLRRASED